MNNDMRQTVSDSNERNFKSSKVEIYKNILKNKLDSGSGFIPTSSTVE